MVGTIFPIGYGDNRRARLVSALIVHSFGYVTGASAIGLVLGGFGNLFQRVLLVRLSEMNLSLIIGVACVVSAGRELRLFPVPLPQSTWQVPIDWRQMPLLIMSFTYAFVLGLGVATRIPASSFFIVLVWAMFRGNVLLAAVVVGGFGLGRAVPFLLGCMVRNPGTPNRVLQITLTLSVLIRV